MFKNAKTVVSLILVSLGCVDIVGPESPPLSPRQVMSQIKIGSDAVIILLGDTLDLNYEVRAMDDSKIEVISENIVWKSSDPNQVSINNQGQIIGKIQSVIPVTIYVTYTHNTVTKADTIEVYVSSAGAQANKIKLVVLDSNRIGANPVLGYPRVRVDLYQDDSLVTAGAQIPLYVPSPLRSVYSQSGGPNGEPVYLINNDKTYLGKFWVKSSVNLYGVEVLDSVEFVGLYPASLPEFGVLAFNINDIVPRDIGVTNPTPNVQPCAFIQIKNSIFGDPVDIVFSDSANEELVCEEVTAETVRLALELSPGSVSHSIAGGNIQSQSMATNSYRRASRLGVTDFYWRQSVTKIPIPVRGRFMTREVQY